MARGIEIAGEAEKITGIKINRTPRIEAPVEQSVILADATIPDRITPLLKDHTSVSSIISKNKVVTTFYTWPASERTLVFGRMPDGGWGIGIIDNESMWDTEDTHESGNLRIIGKKGDIITIDQDRSVAIMNVIPETNKHKPNHNAINAYVIDSNGKLSEGNIDQKDIDRYLQRITQRNMIPTPAQS